MSETTLNLDKLAAEKAQAIVTTGKGVKGVKAPVDTLERLVTKTLGVLQEQGVYAMLLFLYSRTGDEQKVAPMIHTQLFEVLKDIPKFKGNSDVPQHDALAQNALKFYSDSVLNDLDTLLLIRDLYEQTLIYARFGAKAEGK